MEVLSVVAIDKVRVTILLHTSGLTNERKSNLGFDRNCCARSFSYVSVLPGNPSLAPQRQYLDTKCLSAGCIRNFRSISTEPYRNNTESSELQTYRTVNMSAERPMMLSWRKACSVWTASVVLLLDQYRILKAGSSWMFVSKQRSIIWAPGLHHMDWRCPPHKSSSLVSVVSTRTYSYKGP